MKKIIATTKGNWNASAGIVLMCAFCGENNRKNLIVEELGIAVGFAGDNYSFCRKCWNSRTLGKKLLTMLEYPHGMKLKDELLELKVIEG